MIDLILKILQAEQLPYESHAIKSVLGRFVRIEILNVAPELLLVGKPTQLNENVALRLAEVLKVFKVTSIHLQSSHNPRLLPKEIRDMAMWFFLPQSTYGSVHRLHQRLKEQGLALDEEQVLELVVRKVNWLSQWQKNRR